MEFTDDFIHSYRQDITKIIKVSDTEITGADIVSRLAKCIEKNFPKSSTNDYNETIVCKDLMMKRSILEGDVDFVKEFIKEPMATLNMKLSDNIDPFKLSAQHYSVFQSRGLFEKADFESVNCFIRVSNFEYV
jgi:hypothetical protein